MTDHLLLGGPEGPGNQPESRAAAGRPVTDEEDKALARAARWWPQGLERTDPAPPAVSFSKEAVAAWGPPNPAEAAQALATSYRYCTWRLAQSLDLRLDSAFNLDDIVAYIDGPLADSPKSTRKSARTYLRRLDPHRPPAVATPIAIASAARIATSLIPGEEVSGSVADVIDAYLPKTIDAARFERVANLVRSAVKAWGPKTATRATNALCWAAYLAAWVDASGRPLRPDVVFHPDAVEDYLAMRLAASADERTMATEATALRGISKALLPTLLASKRTRIAKALYEIPYSHSEIGQLFASAVSLTTKARRRYGHSLITLGLAVGPFGGEFTGVEPTDVRRPGGGQLVVTLRGFEHHEAVT